MTRDELKVKAKELDVEYKSNISTDKLEELVEAAEMAKKEAGYEKPIKKKDDEPKRVDKATMRKNAMLMKRCIITPLDERLRGAPSEMYSVGNGSLGFIKKVVQFGVETLEPMVIIEHLRDKQALIQQATVVKGMPKVTKKLGKAFAIEMLPDYTEEEWKAIKENK